MRFWRSGSRTGVIWRGVLWFPHRPSIGFLFGNNALRLPWGNMMVDKLVSIKNALNPLIRGKAQLLIKARVNIWIGFFTFSGDRVIKCETLGRFNGGGS